MTKTIVLSSRETTMLISECQVAEDGFKPRVRPRRAFLKACLGVMIGAASTRHARAMVPMPDVIVLLPGIMGSVLRKDGQDVWALSGRALVAGLRSLGNSIGSLKLSGDDPSVDDVGDGISATGLIGGSHLLPEFWKIDGYSEVSEYIRRTFSVTPGVNYFEFAYDWRRDNRVASRRLAKASHDWLKAWRSKSGNRDAKLILVGHSMGGLVARYFIECLDGWKVTKRLVTFGTPFRGSLNALNTLANGVKIGPRMSPGLTDLARSCTSIYQLLPRYQCYQQSTGAWARVGDLVGIPNVDGGKAAGALAFHREIDACVDVNRKSDEYRRNLKVLPIVGAYQRTWQAARQLITGVEMLDRYPNQNWDGDGTVPEVSAIPIELSDAHLEMYVAQRHSALQNTTVALDHMTKVLTRDDHSIRYLRRTEFNRGTRISLTVADSSTTKEPIVIHALSSDGDVALTARVTNADDGHEIVSCPLSRTQDGNYEAVLKPLPEGVYRAMVHTADRSVSATDIFMVTALMF